MAIRFKDPTAATRLGQIVSSLQNAEALLQGSFAQAPTRTGVIGSQLQAATSLIQGAFTPTAARTGTIAASLAPATSLIQGTTTAPGGQPSTAAEDDWIARSTGSGVIFAHDFRSAAEVDLFRWTGGYAGGNDPLAKGVNASRCFWQSADGIPGTGGKCLEQFRPAGSDEASGAWWRIFSPVANNGRSVPDPAANGTIPLETWAPTDGGDQTNTWGQRGVIAHPSFSGTPYIGTELYLQVRVKMDPRRSTGGNESALSQVGSDGGGKLFFISNHLQSLSSQEVVTYSRGHNGGGPGSPNFQRLYVTSGFLPLELADGSSGQQIRNDLGFCDVSTSPGNCWSYSGGWDTLLYHWQPGRPGIKETRARIYGVNEGLSAYRLLWDATYSTEYSTVNGFNAFISSAFQNGANMPQDFWHRYTQIILSKNFIPCPKPSTWTAPLWYVSQANLEWKTPLTNWLGTAGVKDPLADGVNAGSDGHAGIHHDWTGMLIDYGRRMVAFLAAGGHIGAGGYKGNEVYVCDLSADAPVWVRRRNATDSSIGNLNNQQYADGRPMPDHNAQIWIDGDYRYLALGMEADLQGSAALDVWFDYLFAKNDYTKLTNTYGAGSRNGINSCTVKDRKRGHILRVYDNPIPPGIVRVKADTLAVVEQSTGEAFETAQVVSAAIDTTRDLLLVRYNKFSGGAPTGVEFCEVWRLSPTLLRLATLTPTGSKPAWNVSLHYHKPSDAFITWDGGSSIRKLTPTAGGGSYSALAWSTVAAIGGPSPPSTQCAGGFSGEASCYSGQGMYSKVQFMEDMGNGQGALIVAARYFNPDLFVLKLPNGPL